MAGGGALADDLITLLCHPLGAGLPDVVHPTAMSATVTAEMAVHGIERSGFMSSMIALWRHATFSSMSESRRCANTGVEVEPRDGGSENNRINGLTESGTTKAL